jgi:hypothetical protein
LEEVKDPIGDPPRSQSNILMDDGDSGAGDSGDNSASILNVSQRVRSQGRPGNRADGSIVDEIWALIEFEEFTPDMPEATTPPHRFKKWKRFEAETDLEDFIRRDVGEPITLPPYSLAPEQSARIQEEAKRQVAQVMEEFRRFRVKSELARKQADAHIRELQSSHVQTAQRRIEGQDLVSVVYGVIGCGVKTSSIVGTQRAEYCMITGSTIGAGTVRTRPTGSA